MFVAVFSLDNMSDKRRSGRFKGKRKRKNIFEVFLSWQSSVGSEDAGTVYTTP